MTTGGLDSLWSSQRTNVLRHGAAGASLIAVLKNVKFLFWGWGRESTKAGGAGHRVLKTPGQPKHEAAATQARCILKLGSCQG